MPSFINQQIPPPNNWQDFENLCADLWGKIWKDTNAQKNGRSGQAQHGVDVFGRLNGDGDLQGVQCKGKDGRYGKAVTEKELKDEVEKAIKFEPPIKAFILATTAPTDASIQKIARQLTEENEKRGLFSVAVYGWDEIIRRMAEYPIIIDKHFPGQGPTQHRILETLEDLLEQGAVRDETERRHPAGIESVITQTLQNLIPGMLPSIKEGKLHPNDKALNQEIDEYRNLIEDKPKTALDIFERLKKRCWDQASDNIKFRIVTNIGATHLILRNDEKAASLFIQAKQYAPDDHKAVCNTALAYIIQENFEEAKIHSSRAVEIDPDNYQGYALLVGAHSYDNKVDNLESLVPSDKLENSEIAFSLGQSYLRRGLNSKAFEWLERAYEKAADHLQLRISYAEAILMNIFDNPSATIGGQISTDQEEKLNHAIEILQGVWNEVLGTELEALHIVSAINLCQAYRLSEQDDLSKSILDDAIRLSPKSIEARKLAAQFALESGIPEEACEHLSHIPKGMDLEIDLMLAEALAAVPLFNEAFDQIQSISLPEGTSKLKSVAIDLKLRLIFEIKGEEAAFEAAKEAEKEHPNNIFIKVSIANLYNRIGKSEVAIKKAFNIALSLSKSNNYSDRLYVAETLYELSQFDKAREIYNDLVSTFRDSYPLRRLLICLYNTDQRQAALTILDKIPEKDRSHKFFRRFATAIYFRTGELKKAREESEAYLEKAPNDLGVRLNWISILQRQSDDRTISEFLSSCPEYPDAEPMEQMRLAHLFHYHGYLDRSLSLAYELRRKYQRDPNIHMGYIGLLLIGKYDEDIIKPNTIALNTAFTIENEQGERKIFIIENEFIDQLLIEEIPPLHRMAEAANGKLVGDTFVLKTNPFQEEKWTVVIIKSKYLHLMHKTAEEYSSLFPQETNFWKVNLQRKENGKLDFAPIFQNIDNKHSWVREVEEMYKSQNLPIGSVAILLGANPIDVWRGFMRTGRVPIKCCLGNEQERSEAEELLINSDKGCAIDPLTLFSICSLDIQDELTIGIGKFGITQSTLDIYLEQIDSIKLHPPSATLGKIGDQYVMEEFSEEDIQKEILMLQKVHDWGFNNCDILPAIGARDFPVESGNLSEIIDSCFTDTILAASGSDRLLLSDDFNYRLFGKQLMDLDGVWLQAAMLVAVNREALSPKKYSETVANLINANMEFITVNSPVLMTLAEHDGWSVSEKFKKTAKTFGRKNVELRSALNVTNEFLFNIWQSPIEFDQMEAFTYAMLTCFRAWRDLAIIRNLLQIAHILPPYIKNMYIAAIRNWCIGHFIPFPPTDA